MRPRIRHPTTGMGLVNVFAALSAGAKHLYLGNRVFIIMQVLLYCAMESVNISSIVTSNRGWSEG
jgi:hypothetical protein